MWFVLLGVCVVIVYFSFCVVVVSRFGSVFCVVVYYFYILVGVLVIFLFFVLRGSSACDSVVCCLCKMHPHSWV